MNNQYFNIWIILGVLVFTSCTSKYNVIIPPSILYNYVDVNGKKLFYREAGTNHKTTIVLLHGYPSSSHTYRSLIPILATKYHVIAPDNLGSGYSEHPSVDSVEYTFDLLAQINNDLLDSLHIKKYVMYMQDFGAPVGYRMMMNDPKRIEALIIQNANTYMDGLTPERQRFFEAAHYDTTQIQEDFLYRLTSAHSIINQQYLFDIAPNNRNKQNPDAWIHDLYFLKDSTDRMIQVRLFQDYFENLKRYPLWQSMLRENQPKTLIIWGANDQKFNKNGAIAYLRDLPEAELNLIDAGHFAVEEKPGLVGLSIIRFLDKKKIK